MNNVLSSMQTLKSGDDCDKYSKSVSYETLVGGTTTICTDIKQTQRLSEGSANKPLDAVGTLTSLQRNSAKVEEKLLQTLPVFRLVKIIILISVLSVGMVAESRAACNITNDNGDTVDEFGNYCGTCGADCHWVLDDKGNMKITGSGKMADYSPTCVAGRNPRCTTEDRPWQKYREQIKNVDIQGVTTVGTGAFYTIPIENLTLGNSITTLKWDAFEGHGVKILELPDSLTTIGIQAIRASYSVENLIIPDTLNSFTSSSISHNFNIIYRGEVSKCNAIKEKMIKLGYNNNFSLADYTNCASTSFYWNGASCIREPDVSKRKCCSSCKDMGGWCNRIRYTPAEAAPLLHNDNTNEVTITFKK